MNSDSQFCSVFTWDEIKSHIKTYSFDSRCREAIFLFYISTCSNVKSVGAYGYDGEHGVSLGVSEQDVDEGDDLQRLAQAHAVSKDTTEPAAAAEPLHRLHQVVVQETDPTDLKNRERKKSHQKADLDTAMKTLLDYFGDLIIFRYLFPGHLL